MDIKAVSPNSMVVDNYTISSAIQALRGGTYYDLVSAKDYGRPYISDSDIDFRLSADIASFAALTEMIVFHDKLYTDKSTFRWNCGELRNIVELVEMPNQERLVQSSIDKYDEARASYNESSSPLSYNRLMYDLIGLSNYSGRENRWKQYWLDPDFLDKSLSAYMDVERTRSGEIDRLFSGILYYDFMACELKLPYTPHITRSQIILGLDLKSSLIRSNSRILEKRIINIVESARSASSGQINEFFGQMIFQANLPVIFGALIKEAKTPEDILDEAIRLRDSKEAIAIREWMRDVLVAIEDRNISECQKHITKLNDFSEDLLGFGGTPQSQGIQFNVGPISIDPFSGLLRKIYKRNIVWRPLRILRFLKNQVLTMGDINEEIKRVFGADSAKALKSYSYLLQTSDLNKINE